MADIQIEDGKFTRIHNEILEHLVASNLNGTELAVVILIIRKTYGYNKLNDEISLSQFTNAIPVSKEAICNALSKLQLVKIIRLVKKGNSKICSNLWHFNKDFDTWQLVKKTKLVKFSRPTSQDSPPATSQENLTDKRQETKEKTKDRSQPQVAEEKFDFKEKLKVMFSDKDRRMAIIAYYWTIKGWKFDTAQSYSPALKRELRSSGDLIGYTNEQIKKTCEWLKTNADFKWTLETVHKYIDEPLENMGAKGKPKTEDDLIKELQNKYAKH